MNLCISLLFIVRSVLVFMRACGLLMMEDRREVCVDVNLFWRCVKLVMNTHNHMITWQYNPKILELRFSYCVLLVAGSARALAYGASFERRLQRFNAKLRLLVRIKLLIMIKLLQKHAFSYWEMWHVTGG